MELLKDKNEIPNYAEKAKVLLKNGWVTMYNADNWIKEEWIEQGYNYVCMGRTTDAVYISLMKK